MHGSILSRVLEFPKVNGLFGFWPAWVGCTDVCSRSLFRYSNARCIRVVAAQSSKMHDCEQQRSRPKYIVCLFTACKCVLYTRGTFVDTCAKWMTPINRARVQRLDVRELVDARWRRSNRNEICPALLVTRFLTISCFCSYVKNILILTVKKSEKWIDNFWCYW